ncbi:ATP-dependent Clp protease proteolytic subunit [Plasmodium sp. gorilla clade G2]|uniref:ATP-dependent Clp protease proteolytic subunit n=1 Tax=Plasmodium sp. gorilla clade G2 TaxID=880535 RepID=UPI000D226188|nr:ATP-dependent Clp protease proteolytic subunit [Plasmodium sp. gorilla clade G2]SOV10765.1 ATP-dependent Clp protease proteolytic subunit [Plasmodium sp. gorilla clade G2]
MIYFFLFLFLILLKNKKIQTKKSIKNSNILTFIPLSKKNEIIKQNIGKILTYNLQYDQGHTNYKKKVRKINSHNSSSAFGNNYNLDIEKENNKRSILKNEDLNFEIKNDCIISNDNINPKKKYINKKDQGMMEDTNTNDNINDTNNNYNNYNNYLNCEVNKKKRKKKYSKVEQQIITNNDDIKDMKKDVKLYFFKKRIIYLTDEINKKTADELISQLLYLDNINHNDIKIYINSPGGSINEGLAILDIFNYIKSDIQTISFGLVASMASVILASGKKGKRKSLPNCRIMIHQPLGNAFGHPQDIEIQTKEILYLKKVLYHYLSSFTNQSVETIEKDSDRDYYMNALEAKQYGIIDEVIETKLPHPYFNKLEK